MNADSEAIARQLLAEDIWRIVEDARAHRKTLASGREAARLFATYPSANKSVGRIIDDIVVAAIAAGLPVEIDRKVSS